MTKKPERQRSGPKPETVKIDRPWEDAVRDALKRKRPDEGWPEQPKPKPKKKKPA